MDDSIMIMPDQHETEEPLKILEDDRRIKILPVDERHVLEWAIKCNNELPTYWCQMKAIELPEGFQLRGVRHDFVTCTFQFAIWHPSFPVVPFGERPPFIQSDMVMSYIPLQPLADE